MEYVGLFDEIEENKDTKEFRGSTEFSFFGIPKFDEKDPIQFSLRFNCTSSCLIPVIGPKAKLLISISTFTGKNFLREYTHGITVASQLKKKYDDHMDDLEGQESSEEERERSRKRRRTSAY